VVSFTTRSLYSRGKRIRQEAGWAPEPIWTTWRRENYCPHRDLNSDPSVVQPVASRYTDCAIPAPPYINSQIQIRNTFLSRPTYFVHDFGKYANFSVIKFSVFIFPYKIRVLPSRHIISFLLLSRSVINLL
jgi:hypothetical protein